MKAIEKYIHRHDNRTLYFVARREGQLFVRSYNTGELEEARRLLREKGMDYFCHKKSRFEKPAGSKPKSEKE